MKRVFDCTLAERKARCRRASGSSALGRADHNRAWMVDGLLCEPCWAPEFLEPDFRTVSITAARALGASTPI